MEAGRELGRVVVGALRNAGEPGQHCNGEQTRGTRDVGDGTRYTRLTEFVMPYYEFIPPPVLTPNRFPVASITS